MEVDGVMRPSETPGGLAGVAPWAETPRARRNWGHGYSSSGRASERLFMQRAGAAVTGGVSLPRRRLVTNVGDVPLRKRGLRGPPPRLAFPARHAELDSSERAARQGVGDTIAGLSEQAGRSCPASRMRALPAPRSMGRWSQTVGPARRSGSSHTHTHDREFGCRSWSGTYMMTGRTRRWLIAIASISHHPCGR
jgi:hypothetical protein